MDKIKKVLIIGSGAIVIGQGAEFDYSGTQACRVFKENKIETILINNNPATIMTDKEIADKVYMEPITLEFLVKIIEKEKPDSIMISVGGQTALNVGIELEENGLLDKYHIKVLGTQIEDIKNSESRDLFYNKMIEIDQPVLKSSLVKSLDEAKNIAELVGYPLIIRPAYTLGGNGGGIAENEEDLERIVTSGLNLSVTSELLIEKSIKGWKEIEYEMMRDKNGNIVTVCNMENIDPVGIHTGDSIVVAPSQTLSDIQYQNLRNASIEIINSLNIVGGCNVQFAYNQIKKEYVVIEVNSRVSRSSALASKATGYPIAKITAMISLGYTLDEIVNDVTKKTKASFEPSLDYITVKIPKLPFDKFRNSKNELGTSMMATGEVMGIGRNFESALLKSIRSLEMEYFSLYNEEFTRYTLSELLDKIKFVDDIRIFYLAELIRREVSIDLLERITKIDKFFLSKIKNIVLLEKSIFNRDYKTITKKEIENLKKNGFSDKGIANLTLFSTELLIREYRKKLNVFPSYKMVDTCGGEFDAISPYYYSSYNVYDEIKVSSRKKIIVIGSGPIRIGQGIEFDYSTVHAILALKKRNIETIIVNNNPETVSTDFNLSDKLYFEPITFEDVMNIIDKEKPYGVILQFGGQTSIKLAKKFEENGVNILGSRYDALHKAEERSEFIKILENESILYPKGFGVDNNNLSENVKNELSYPVLVRPSYVLGGLGMKIIYDYNNLSSYINNAFNNNPNNTILIDEYVDGIEIEVDGISDGEDIFLPGIMEHIDRSGIHSGDSALVFPPINLSKIVLDELFVISKKIVTAIGIVGLFNIQYVLSNNKIYIIEVNPRSSRTIPFISKASGINLVESSIDIILGNKKIKELDLESKEHNNGYYIKSPVFSTYKIKNEDTILGPEMKSTGETISIDKTFYGAFYKSMIKIGIEGENIKKIFFSGGKNKTEEIDVIIGDLIENNVNIYVSEEDYIYYKNKYNQKCDLIHEVTFSETIVKIKNKEFDFVVSLSSFNEKYNSYFKKIRRGAIENGLPCITSTDSIKHLAIMLSKNIKKKNLQVYNINMKEL
ncbi:carbamoyl-phosphate synthase (glutamine-hydrolyzing) large subunit [Helicovermis profundi]|uniref:Carbamoyl-phosphate synthase large subunit n=1 Tax=Helicovermis profundi TaxID=3065157 RepID=A0AAU9E322_9FIRM|nr:carbamoyl-phosphate synthase large subunit [Clostridia bacterium S502]